MSKQHHDIGQQKRLKNQLAAEKRKHQTANRTARTTKEEQTND